MRTTPGECAELGARLAGRLSRASGPRRHGVPAAEGAVPGIASHDHQAAAIGAGATGAGDELDSCGTAEALVRTIQAGLGAGPMLELTRAGITVGWHAVPGHWCLLGATEGGLAMQRLLGQAGVDRRTCPRWIPRRGGRWVTRGQQEAMALHDAMTAVAGEAPEADRGRRMAAQRRVRGRQGAVLRAGVAPAGGGAGARGAALTAGVAAGVYPDFLTCRRRSISEDAARDRHRDPEPQRGPGTYESRPWLQARSTAPPRSTRNPAARGST